MNVLLVVLLTIGMASAFVAYRATLITQDIGNESLELHLDQIIRSIEKNTSGKLDLVLPTALRSSFSPSSHDNVFIVKSASGDILWTSHPELNQIATEWMNDGDGKAFIRLEQIFPDRPQFYGITREYNTPYGKFVGLIAHNGDSGEFARYISTEFIEDLVWVAPLFVLVMVGTVMVTIHKSLAALSETSAKAATIDLATANVRLVTDGLPREIAPLVHAVNGALNRLDEGLSAERRFTADAAHQLRTPLSVLKARIDNLTAAPDTADLSALKGDVDRMARVVAQLLAAARLEMPQPEIRTVVLNELIRDIVVALAPLAMARKQDLAVALPQQVVLREADYAELAEAVRNLIENAIVHCPPGAQIEITLQESGAIRVMDTGPGIPDGDKMRIFERFFRSQQTATSGSGVGLGLSIVRRVARRYGGSVVVEDTPGGGATFVLDLPADAV